MWLFKMSPDEWWKISNYAWRSQEDFEHTQAILHWTILAVGIKRSIIGNCCALANILEYSHMSDFNLPLLFINELTMKNDDNSCEVQETPWWHWYVCKCPLTLIGTKQIFESWGAVQLKKIEDISKHTTKVYLSTLICVYIAT